MAQTTKRKRGTAEVTGPLPTEKLDPEKLKTLAQRFLNNEDPRVLAREIGVTAGRLLHEFRSMGIARDKTMTEAAAGKEVRRQEVKALTEEAEHLTTLALAIGGIISRRYQPLIDYELGTGKTIEILTEEIMSWFENKTGTLGRIDKLEGEFNVINERLVEYEFMAKPNFRFLLKARIFSGFVKDMLRLKALRIPINTQATLAALHAELEKLDDTVEHEFAQELIVNG